MSAMYDVHDTLRLKDAILAQLSAEKHNIVVVVDVGLIASM